MTGHPADMPKEGPVSLKPLSVEQWYALPPRERQLQAIGDVVAGWIDWVTRERAAEGLTTEPDTYIMLSYEGAPPHWPSVGQLTKWLEVIRAGADIAANHEPGDR